MKGENTPTDVLLKVCNISECIISKNVECIDDSWEEALYGFA